MNKNVKFGLIIAVILGTLGWLAAGGITQTASYYKEIAELEKMGPSGVDKRLRVGGDVELNSISRDGRDVHRGRSNSGEGRREAPAESGLQRNRSAARYVQGQCTLPGVGGWQARLR